MGWKEVKPGKVKSIIRRDLPEKIINELFTDKQFLVNSDKNASISMVSKEVFDCFNKIKAKAIQPLFIGCSVCDTQDLKKARLNLQFATKVSVFELPKAFINHKAEQLFLYSRDVWSNSIIKVERAPARQKIIFVFNEEEIFLGLGFALTDELIEKGRKLVIKNVIDIGSYLRIEK
ncbi:MAG: hypothetical protein WC307_01700 [Candidatus Nanoarchaeia archaeon]|jgi:ribosome biogenesis protein Nip4